MVTISCAFRYSVSARSTGTLISTAAPAWSRPATRSVSRGSSGFGTIRGAGDLVAVVMAAQYDIPGQPDISIGTVLGRRSGRAFWVVLEQGMKVIGLAGWSGAGKTTLLARLIPHLVAQGLR